jgi:hypothetical protein
MIDVMSVILRRATRAGELSRSRTAGMLTVRPMPVACGAFGASLLGSGFSAG